MDVLVKKMGPSWFPFLGFAPIHPDSYKELDLDPKYNWKAFLFQWFGVGMIFAIKTDGVSNGS